MNNTQCIKDIFVLSLSLAARSQADQDERSVEGGSPVIACLPGQRVTVGITMETEDEFIYLPEGKCSMRDTRLIQQLLNTLFNLKKLK